MGSDWVVVDGRSGGDRVGTDSRQTGRSERGLLEVGPSVESGRKAGAAGGRRGAVWLGAVWCCLVRPNAARCPDGLLTAMRGMWLGGGT